MVFKLQNPWICIKFRAGEKVTFFQVRRCSWSLGLPPSNLCLWVAVTMGTTPMVHAVDPTGENPWTPQTPHRAAWMVEVPFADIGCCLTFLFRSGRNTPISQGEGNL